MRAALVLPLFALVFACAHGKEGVELNAQTGEDLSGGTRVNDAPPASSREAVTLGRPAPSDTPVEERPAPPPVADHVDARCPVTCFFAEPRHARPVTAQELEQLKSALGPTLDGVRQCTGGAATQRHYPIINLRFNTAGELTDMGVDSTGYDQTADDCMQQVVRGSTSLPKVTFQGPSTVRCTERCERPHPTTRKK